MLIKRPPPTPQEKYNAKNCVGVYLKLNRTTDADILARLEAAESKQGFIKAAMRAEIAREKKEEPNMRTTTILVNTYGVHRYLDADGNTLHFDRFPLPHEPYERAEYKALAAVDFAESGSVSLPDGWALDGGAGRLGKLVQIELPPDVAYGWWVWRGANLRSLGLYAQTDAGDGHGRTVYARVNAPTLVDTSADAAGYEAAIDAAIASGVTLSVPRKGGRVDVPVKVLAVSPYNPTVTVAAWSAWADAHRSPQEDEPQALS